MKIFKSTIYNTIKNIKDPEFNLTLEELNILNIDNIIIDIIKSDTNSKNNILNVKILVTPTVPHCSLAAVIGLSIYYKLYNSTLLDLCNLKDLDNNIYYIRYIVNIEEGSHNNYISINKQLNDKERVRAAFENVNIMRIIESCVNFIKKNDTDNDNKIDSENLYNSDD